MRTSVLLLLLLSACMSPAFGQIIINPANGHCYEFVPADDISWTKAKSQAEAKVVVTINGVTLRGYLATITSQSEQDFLFKNFGQHELIWLGATDGDNDKPGVNSWKWVTGPEKGQEFWRGGTTGKPLGYEYWMRTPKGYVEPNDSGGGESYLNWNHRNPPDLGKRGFWNDLKNDTPNDVVSGFLVEYGGFGESCCATCNRRCRRCRR